MARKRMIVPTIWDDPTFNSKSVKARLAFIGMISNADDEGYIRSDYKSLKRLIFGFDEDSSDVWYKELRDFRSLHFFEESGEIYAHFLKWHDYQVQQKERIQRSIFPKCNVCLSLAEQTLTEVSKLSKEVKEVSKGNDLIKNSREKLKDKWGTKR